jgi:transglutaminase-like putative cysteine protease
VAVGGAVVVTRISIHTELAYDVTARTSFSFAVLAAANERQHVDTSHLTMPEGLDVRSVHFGTDRHELLQVTVDPAPLVLTYDATVTLRAHIPDDVPRRETPFAELPGEVLGDLHPSRYCPSDLLGRFAGQTFGRLAPGFERVTGICNWIWDHLSYVPGSTDSTTTAVDVLVGAAGVCRDYAHLAISFCRALGIPARYVSGYAVDLQPPDFHGFFEAYLDGHWYLFDATRMAPIDGLVRIAAGRDAADVAFAAIVGQATLTTKEIVVVHLDRTQPDDGTTTAAISTA